MATASIRETRKHKYKRPIESLGPRAKGYDWFAGGDRGGDDVIVAGGDPGGWCSSWWWCDDEPSDGRRFRRIEREMEKECMSADAFRRRFFSGGSCRWRSERWLCMRCIATPLSSVAKLKPRLMVRRPVAMSVRLAWNAADRSCRLCLLISLRLGGR